MATPAQAWEHRIKLGGQALSQNSSSNKANTARLQRLTHSQICEKGFRAGRFLKVDTATSSGAIFGSSFASK
jgi:hypothetical protein